MSTDEHLFLDVLHRLNWPRRERLIFADWLDEHGREREALAIREHVLGQLVEEFYRVPPLPRRGR